MGTDSKGMGRRQFLVGTGVASASALALNRFAGGGAGPVDAARAAGKTKGRGAGFSDRYRHLLTPFVSGTRSSKTG